MNGNQVTDVLARAFAAEGVDTLFTLLGDANMHWSASMADNQKVRLIHARHEHCCVAMADAWARATGKVGVASVTCGPGYTQIMTALAMAARGNAPVVVSSARWSCTQHALVGARRRAVEEGRLRR